MNSKVRSLLFAMLGGMMAASLLHVRKVVDLSFGFAPGTLGEGAAIAIVGAAAGAAVLLAFRKVSEMRGGDGEDGKD